MTRADDIGRAARDEAPPPTSDKAFLAGLDVAITRRDRRARRMRMATAAALLLALGAVWARSPESPSTNVAVIEAEEPELTDDPVAAILLEAARLRLDGFGDAAAAIPRLREIVTDYPGSRSAVVARTLLERSGEAR